MKLIFKGIYKSEDQLPKGTLPANAVKFREPDSMLELNITAALYAIPAVLLIALIMVGSRLLHGRINLQDFWNNNIIGVLLAFLTIVPHELMHAVCFGRNAEVEFFVAPKQLMAFVTCTQPITKMRFIFLSLFPNLVFGWVPLLIWAALPYGQYSNILFAFSVMAILFGVGDYMNASNAIRQMPKGSLQQLSGFHSYWFMPF